MSFKENIETVVRRRMISWFEKQYGFITAFVTLLKVSSEFMDPWYKNIISREGDYQIGNDGQHSVSYVTEFPVDVQ